VNDEEYSRDKTELKVGYLVAVTMLGLGCLTPGTVIEIECVRRIAERLAMGRYRFSLLRRLSKMMMNNIPHEQKTYYDNATIGPITFLLVEFVAFFEITATMTLLSSDDDPKLEHLTDNDDDDDDDDNDGDDDEKAEECLEVLSSLPALVVVVL
jgi:hypothetical protein